MSAESIEMVRNATVAGCTIPIWRLEMARRAGSSADSILAVYPEIPRCDLEAAFEYATKHRAEIDRLIELHGPRPIPPDDVATFEDDEEEFERELLEDLERNAEVYRRLAE
jgi:uncharacterized protein (DUF433 family)